jgi:NAD(P)H-dependent flavin oxidoreductase YrpB (nitropropane dioxygenase family)
MSERIRLPQIIQGGMGIAVSNWRLARAVASAGQLGVVSGTAIDSVLVRRLQDGDPCGSVRRAMAHFPLPDVTAHVLRKFFKPEGRAADEPYSLLPMYRQTMAPLRQQITMLAAFVEVTLAKEGHDGMVGINLLTKLQMPNLPTLYGAMLAGVNVVLMGAGIPREIPGALDAMARHEAASVKFDVEAQVAGTTDYLTFDPRLHNDAIDGPLHRPLFFPIVSAASLAQSLARKSNGRVDGFIVEGPTAGGHNAPPRGALRLSESGEPIYGDRDIVDMSAMREIGLPFWLAGGSGSPEGLDAALAVGATGIQVGTLFAYSEEAGFTREIQSAVIDAAVEERLSVRTDPRASPTGYPFKVAMVDDQPVLHGIRTRVCDLGYLRTAIKTEAGRIIYRCPSEPIEQYVKKGGDVAETEHRQCLCNALMACIGMGQERDGYVEPPIVTSGDDVKFLNRFLQGRDSYRASDVIAYLTRTALVPA